MTIYCAGCYGYVNARLTSGKEIYSHRPDLAHLPFWKCDACGNYVGCHHKTKDRTRPLGIIPTNEMREVRQKIHALIDPLWQLGKRHRKAVYAMMAKELNIRSYHTADLHSLDDCLVAYSVALKLTRTELQKQE
jgi:hypothetical protein